MVLDMIRMCSHSAKANMANASRVYTSKHVPTAMIFVRCKDGISHNPAEYSRPEDCAEGARVLLGAYLRYDDHVRKEHQASA